MQSNYQKKGVPRVPRIPVKKVQGVAGMIEEQTRPKGLERWLPGLKEGPKNLLREG